MTTILIMTGIVIAAGLVTAVILWLDRPRKCRTHEIDSARLIRALKGE